MWDAAKIANPVALRNAANNAQRVPNAVADKIFTIDGWRIPSASQGGFYTNDPITGFAANLFVNDQTKEKVLAIRGTEPNTVDILQADLLEIGLIGVALSQAVSLFNYVMRLSSPLSTTANVAQFRVVAGATPAPTNLASNISFSSGGKKIYYWLETAAFATGFDQLHPGDNVTVTGHSLGGHLAALAVRMFPQLFQNAVTFNAPGFDASTKDEWIGIAGTYLANFAANSPGSQAVQLIGPTGQQLSNQIIFQTQASERWLAARCRDLLPVPYFHLVFTLPHQLNALAQGNPAVMYALLFQAASSTLLTFGANPRWLGGQLGATLVLHTWGQTLTQHLHVHAVVTGGALSVDGQWHAPRRGFLFPVKALSKVFRAKFLAGLAAHFARHTFWLAGTTDGLATAAGQQALMRQLRAHPWVVYAKAPMAGPAQVLEYLSRYTHRVALSNERLINASDDAVHFRYKDYAQGGRRRVMVLTPDEFIRRFLLHVLPRGFVRIRHYGLNSPRDKHHRLNRCRQALAQPPLPTPNPVLKETLVEFWRRVAAVDIMQCRVCAQGGLRMVASLQPYRPSARGPPKPDD